MTNDPTPEGVDTKTSASDRSTPVTVITSIALAILVAGSLIDHFAGVDGAYLVSRVVAAPVLVVALVIGIRRRTGRALIWPAILLAVAVAASVSELS
ncbi:hypothetical protein [Promicromonospora iranensis]|uniref:Uncharacterized protein n=1 Tax=Promicromonospora iranensis TaxID=1105144 RepID=A0ABU2CN54_9MICO|nr:hypothetical protein [Promicromonospora iranensis]MDR7382776.1 hypothetical protein [Promicromonospora iranensis]